MKQMTPGVGVQDLSATPSENNWGRTTMNNWGRTTIKF